MEKNKRSLEECCEGARKERSGSQEDNEYEEDGHDEKDWWEQADEKDEKDE